MQTEVRLEHFERMAAADGEMAADGFGDPGGITRENLVEQILMSARRIVGRRLPHRTEPD